MSAAHMPPHILPLVERLAHEKPVENGLLIARDFAALTSWSAGWPGTWQQRELWLLTSLPFNKRFDLAVIVLDEQYLDETTFSRVESNSSADVATHHTGAHVIAQGITHLRDLLARRVLVVAYGDQSAGLRALGFSQIEKIEGWELWQFNILEYKEVPDWLNSKHWANPENWGKFRW